MADVYAIFGILLTLAIVFPGMLAAWWLLFPRTVERSRIRLDERPWQCLWLGGIVTVVLAVPIATLLALPAGLTQFLGGSLLILALAFASLGTAGLAAKMGKALADRAGNGMSPAGAFLRGAVALEMAAAFPFIGWLLVIPLMAVSSLGAATYALVRRRTGLEAKPSREVSDTASPLPLSQS